MDSMYGKTNIWKCYLSIFLFVAPSNLRDPSTVAIIEHLVLEQIIQHRIRWCSIRTFTDADDQKGISPENGRLRLTIDPDLKMNAYGFGFMFFIQIESYIWAIFQKIESLKSAINIRLNE